MAGAEHRIGRLVFELAAPHQQAVAGLDSALREHFEALILPALEQALDRIDQPGQITRIERLELDLGSFTAGSLDAGELARLLADELIAALQSAQSTAGSGLSASPRTAADELFDFLKSGELQWSAPGQALDLLSHELLALESWPLQQLANRLRPLLIRQQCCQRLLLQLPQALLRRLLHALLPQELDMLVTATFGADRPAASAALDPAPASLHPPLLRLLQQIGLGQPISDTGEVLSLLALLDSRNSLPVALMQLQSAGHAPQPARSEPARQPEPVLASAQSRSVHGAGAVLLHPYLPMFFNRLGLLAAPGCFRDLDCQCRAVLLTHHLASGSDEAPEPETLLGKLLCGLPFDHPLPRQYNLSTQERDEASALLRSLIEHWGRLGNTSPAGLREGFLLRPGTLHSQGEHWLLQVESSGIDILLDDLPWTLSRVRTPFMASLLSVEWR